VSQPLSESAHSIHRRSFIGGSDARIMMGDDESALVRLWSEKRGEVEPEDLSGNLIVQLGTVTEQGPHQCLRRSPRPRLSNSTDWLLRRLNPRESDLYRHQASFAEARNPAGQGGHDGRHYFLGNLRGFRSRTPSPPPLSSIK
jgi:hypothetical protein